VIWKKKKCKKHARNGKYIRNIGQRSLTLSLPSILLPVYLPVQPFSADD
jgi:hypothetical protein